jgi:glutamate carboxypeptidase
MSAAELGPDWVADAADRVAHHFERELEALVAVSSPSGDAAAAEELCALVAALLPDEAEIERP